MSASFLRTLLFFGLLGTAMGQVTTPGFLNQPRAEVPGTLLSHPITNGSEPIGRTTSINYLNGWVVVGGEQPGSRPESDWQMRVYDISNPTSPVRRMPADFNLSYANNSWHFGNVGWNAHGTAQSGNLLLPNVVRVSSFGGIIERGGTNGIPQNGQLLTGYNRSSQAGPWDASFPWYGSPDDTFYIRQVYINQSGSTDFRPLATFDHVGAYGGGDWHPMFFGDLLIYARSGGSARDGVVVYRMQYNNFDDPNTRSITPQYVGSLSGGFEGYWPTFYSDGTGLFVIGAATNVVMAADITEATMPSGSGSISLIASLTVPGLTNAPYPVFQDNFGFIHNRKIDMNRLIAGDANPITLTLNEGAPNMVNTSQMSLALGNLWITGGYPQNYGTAQYQSQGMAVWVHQQAADTNPPRVTYHIPQANRTQYPRHAPLSFLVFEHPRNGGPRNGIDFTVRPVQAGNTLGAAVEGFLIHDFSGVMTFTPTNGLAADTTYQVDFLSDPDNQIGFRDAAGNYIEPYSYRFSTGGGINATAPPVFTSLTASHYQPEPNSPITVSAIASGNGPLEYRFNFNGTWTMWTNSASAEFTYTSAGRPRVLAQVRDASLNIATNSLTLLVISPPPAGPRPTQSSTMTVGEDLGVRRVWSVNPDANTVTVINAITGAKLAEYPVGGNPRSIARDANGRYWVTCHTTDEIRVLNSDGTTHTTLALPYGSGPFAVAPSPDGQQLFVSLYGSARLHRYSAAAPTAAPLTQTTFPTPRAIAVSGNGNRILVTRFISTDLQAEIAEFSNGLAPVRLLTLSSAHTIDGGDRAAGVPNYLAGIAISPDGARAAVVSKQDNVLRGLAFGVSDLTHETTVRSVISFIDLGTNNEIRHTRRDFDNSDSPTAVAYTPLGDSLLVTIQGNNTLIGIDALGIAPVDSDSTNGATRSSPAVLSLEVGTGLAPQGVLIDSVTNRIFAQNFMGRSITVLNGQPLLVENRTSLPWIATTPTVSTELLTAQVLLGKKIFYNAADTRMGADSYISCASCHVDGGHDGRVWDFTGRGEGLRRTTDLRGRSGVGHGNAHWSGNFDEIQDFEHDIRGPFGGTGFLNLSPQQFANQHPSPATGKIGLSPELDALAAYVSSLTPAHTPRSPNRNPDGTLTAAAGRGQSVFAAQNCASCHSGSAFTNSNVSPIGSTILSNVGTQSILSGARLGQPLVGIDTPTLHGLHATRVYLHHGQSATLSDVFGYAGGVYYQASEAQYLGNVGTTVDQPTEGGGGYYRGAFGGNSAYLDSGAAASIRFNNVNGGLGGMARIAFRYVRQYNNGTATLVINGVPQVINVLMQTPSNDWQTSGWRWYVVEAPLNPGATNTLEIQRTDSNHIQVNALLVANASQLALAQPHRAVQSLASGDRSDLLAYLTQLDGRDAAGSPIAPPAEPTPLPPSFVRLPAGVTLAVGNPLSLTVAVAGTGPFNYQWRRGNTLVGSDSPEFSLPAVSLADGGSYTVEVTNSQGSIVSAAIPITVNGALEIATTSLPTTTVGRTYSTSLSASGGVDSRTWSLVSGALPPGLSLSSAGVISGTALAPARSQVTFQVSDFSGSATRSLTLNVRPVGGFVTDPDLILHYSFDEGSGTRVWDSATGGNDHATDVAGAQWISNGRFGGAYGPSNPSAPFLDFTPANQSDLDFDPRANAFTISVWARTTATGGYNTLIGKDMAVSPWNNVQYRLWMVNTGNSLQGINGNQYGNTFNISAAPINNGQWHLVTLVNYMDGSTWRSRLYYDNGATYSQFNTGAAGRVASLMRIGDTSRGGNAWYGQLDDLRIYRRALSQTEIATLYDAPVVESYESWSSSNLSPAQLASPTLSNPEGDANSNGVANLMEFAIGSTPLHLQLLGPVGNQTARLTLTRNSIARDIILVVECSNDLINWTPLATSINGETPTGTASISEGTGILRSLQVSTLFANIPTFYRARVTRMD